MMRRMRISGERKCFPTRCRYCGQRVFYFENEFGAKLFFDSLGPPWPKHRCAAYLAARNYGSPSPNRA